MTPIGIHVLDAMIDLFGEIEQVFLYNVDDLQTAVRENMARRA